MVPLKNQQLVTFLWLFSPALHYKVSVIKKQFLNFIFLSLHTPLSPVHFPLYLCLWVHFQTTYLFYLHLDFYAGRLDNTGYLMSICSVHREIKQCCAKASPSAFSPSCSLSHEICLLRVCCARPPSQIELHNLALLVCDWIPPRIRDSLKVALDFKSENRSYILADICSPLWASSLPEKRCVCLRAYVNNDVVV